MSKKQKNGHKNGHRSSSSSSTSSIISFNQIVLIAIGAFLFYLSIDSRLSDRSKELVLFDSFNGPFAENNDLFNADKILTGQLPGPESIASYKGDLYTGTKDGRIVRINGLNNKQSTVIQLGPDSCLGKVNIKSCGRPLGVRVTSSGDLYTVDALNGLIKVTNIDGTGQPEAKTLFDISSPVNGNASVFLDDLVVDDRSPDDRVIYMTDASTLWDINNAVPLIMDMDDSGRIIKYSESSGQVEVILDKLAFPNGIELTDSKDALLIGEFTNRRLLKHYLKGPKKDTTEVFLNLPGEPDNIRRSARQDAETYWVAISAPRTKSLLLAYDFYSDKPTMRKIVVTCYQIIGSTIENLGHLFGFSNLIESGQSIKTLQPFWETDRRSMVIEIDSTGSVIKCLHSNDGYIHSLSEVNEEMTETGQRILRLGSYANDFLGILNLKN